MVIWISGPSGAGKTTIGRALRDHLKPRFPSIFLLDGDEFRAAMGNDLGFAAGDRRINGLRIAGMAHLLEANGITVICCGVTIHPEAQAFSFANLQEYYQVFVEVSLETLCRRDTKDIYRRALDGQMVDVVGVDMKLDLPQTPHLVLNNDENRESFRDLIRSIMDHIEASTETTTHEQPQRFSKNPERLPT